MEYSPFWSAAGGAITGFVLAQLVNFAKASRAWWTRPKLKIEGRDFDWVLLSHSVEVAQGLSYDEIQYGFDVSNAGRSLATGVRFQVINVEAKRSASEHFRPACSTALDLRLYNSRSEPAKQTVTIVPGARVQVSLGVWREDVDVVFPAANGLPDYYEESCLGSVAYRFTIAAFDDQRRLVSTVATIDFRRGSPS